MSALRQIDWYGHRNLMKWLATGERGLSSEAIVGYLTGVLPKRYGRWDHPYDPDDVRRCALLLDAVPLLRLHLRDMAAASHEWAALVGKWDEIEGLCREECEGEWPHDARGSAPRAYALIQECIDRARTVRA